MAGASRERERESTREAHTGIERMEGRPMPRRGEIRGDTREEIERKRNEGREKEVEGVR
jgi:hypothetical protein